ncbi:hypothetical protein TTHERM_00044980 (macronuclear) [Tetrahymena thermophila SB210]|uniref:Uncharacterized protein n=1 Tax=Tetrahymena thermophila (strain SB210) TaxID=312017 RepID=Q23DU4_TETTS|nr:hypothetical protein TTHERM_00044980 [Tetrahymena thermophila SB210]EAR94665.1 hypothetical protein TTHERM_00044980 [Tetrahymena thermophila SB210]|eukprot:XP_001014592.1 hypothetical protein TTHERM_00044980 [Tetrahymena thermophila SB210]
MTEQVEEKNLRPARIYNFIKQDYIDMRELPNVKVSSGSYSISTEDKKLAIKSIIMRKKRQRGYDRILFQTQNTVRSKEEEAELKKDRHSFINYLKRKYKTQIPEELLDKSKQIQKQHSRGWTISDIIQYVEQKNSKKAIKKELKKEEKTKDKKKKEKQEQEEQEKDNFNEDESFEELANIDDDNINDESGGGDYDD